MSSAFIKGNDVSVDRIRQSLRLVADFLGGGVAADERLDLRMLLQDFAVDDDTLTSQHQLQLDQLLMIGARFVDMRVTEVVGRASAPGPEANNVALSERRATAVTSYLVANGLRSGDPRLHDRIGEVRGVGSSQPIIDVGPVEEPLNRSVEVAWAFDHLPELPALDPALGWTLQFGPDNAWTFVGEQKLTLQRTDTDESRQGTFQYGDVSLSSGLFSRVFKALARQGSLFESTPSQLLDEAMDQLPERWQRWLVDLTLQGATGLSIMPADTGAPVPLVARFPLTWEMFEGPVWLMQPATLAVPVGQVGFASLLVFGWPHDIAVAVKGVDASTGLGAIFPEFSTGCKMGYFAFD